MIALEMGKASDHDVTCVPSCCCVHHPPHLYAFGAPEFVVRRARGIVAATRFAVLIARSDRMEAGSGHEWQCTALSSGLPARAQEFAPPTVGLSGDEEGWRGERTGAAEHSHRVLTCHKSLP